MPIIRESPRAHLSPDKNTTQWPPRSPFQALLSSPSGRRKWQDRRERSEAGRDLSPSPRRRVQQAALEHEEDDADEDEDEDEDEETLQLKLAAIEAKLKLKKLRNKARKEAEGDEGSIRSTSPIKPKSKSPAPSGSLSRAAPNGSRSDIQVPLSPTRTTRPPPDVQLSPARARLGLHAIQKADNVSLKRARDGTQVKAAHQHRSTKAKESDGFATAVPKPSFTERLARSKVEALEERKKAERLEKVRSTGFGGAGGNERPASAHQFQSGKKLDEARGAAKSATARAPGSSEAREIPRANGIFASRPTLSPAINITQSAQHPNAAAENSDASLEISHDSEDTQPTASHYDPYTSLHLSKRHIAHPDVAREMTGKEIYTLPRLLKEVKAPDYDPPDCETDWVLFAVLAGKSGALDHARPSAKKDDEEGKEVAPQKKFMVLHLTDLKWDLDCFLFGSAFDQFWRLVPGTLIAILNPGILPPKTNTHNGRFTLKLGSSSDCVMEIGIARDLGFCASRKKDGKLCDAWIDKRKSELCAFHLEMMVERERKGRMEVNTMWRSHNGQNERHKPASKTQSKNPSGAGGGGKYHREYGNLYTVPGTGSAARLLDAEDKPFAHEEAEKSRQRIAEAQREREVRAGLAALAERGKGGVGAEYLRAGTKLKPGSYEPEKGGGGGEAFFEKPSAAALGLLGNRAEGQRLSPPKERKRHFGLGLPDKGEAMGWGGAKKAGLLLPKEREVEEGQTRLESVGVGSESRARSRSPVKKKARFALGEMGMKVPGRESLGGGQTSGGVDVEDEDDELDIV